MWKYSSHTEVRETIPEIKSVHVEASFEEIMIAFFHFQLTNDTGVFSVLQETIVSNAYCFYKKWQIDCTHFEVRRCRFKTLICIPSPF